MRERRQQQVIGRGRLRGVVLPGNLTFEERQFRLIRTDFGRDYIVPADALRAEGDGTHSLNLSREDLEQYAVERQFGRSVPSPGESERPGTAATEMVIPVVAETLHVGRRSVETGRLRVHKRVKAEDTVVDEPVLTDRYEVNRVPVNKPVSGPVATRVEGDTLIVPLLEEVLVTEKRLVLREELHITRKRVQTRERKKVTLRKEYVDVERVKRAGS